VGIVITLASAETILMNNKSKSFAIDLDVHWSGLITMDATKLQAPCQAGTI
jgi:hypothetical protein